MFDCALNVSHILNLGCMIVISSVNGRTADNAEGQFKTEMTKKLEAERGDGPPSDPQNEILPATTEEPAAIETTEGPVEIDTTDGPAPTETTEEPAPSNEPPEGNYSIYVLTLFYKINETCSSKLNRIFNICQFKLGCLRLDNDICLQNSEGWEGYSCSDVGLDWCQFWAKDTRRCCPDACNSIQFTEEECSLYPEWIGGNCTYPYPSTCRKYRKTLLILI